MYSQARCAGNASTLLLPLPSPCPTIAEATRMPAMIATIAQNSVVLNACFVSVVRRAMTPGRAEVLLLPRASVAMLTPSLFMWAHGPGASLFGRTTQRLSGQISYGPILRLPGGAGPRPEATWLPLIPPSPSGQGQRPRGACGRGKV